ncbi:MAG: hemolysin family protein [Chloroherpetonaceae bacterium]|nr:hemolysin family protein [Chthonomonadaceae bacterium]MDW8207342.1 hemolysin family protein [Chloroherpetonaceae bacterium]
MKSTCVQNRDLMDEGSKNALGLLAVAGLVLLNGFFVAAEFALVSVRKTRIEQLVNEGNRRARAVQRALAHLDTYIAATQLGITMASLGLGFIGEPALARLIEPLFRAFLPERGAAITAHGVAITVAFGIATALHIILGELAPKSIALQRPDTTSLWVAGPLDLFLRVFRPFIHALNATGNLVVRLMGLRSVGERASVHSVEELELLVHTSREAGIIEEEQERMVTGVFDFEETVVRKLMTPRPDITAIDVNATPEDLIRVVSESGHSRIPVYEGNLDNIVGIVHIKDVLKHLAGERPQFSLREVLRPPYFVPENKRAGYLLAEMRRSRTQVAIVRDEYGVVSGLVSIEDLLEEIVGEIQDEYDAELPPVEQVDENTWLVNGTLTLDDFNELTGADVPSDEADTVGGFVFSQCGHQPVQGETVVWDGLEFTVDRTDGRRVLRVRVFKRMHAHVEADAPQAEQDVTRTSSIS